MPEKEGPIHAVTLGSGDCLDVRFARIAADVKGARHHIKKLGKDGWVGPNIEFIWRSDGEIGFIDSCGTQYLPQMARLFSVCQNGIGGSAIHNGMFLNLKTLQFKGTSDPYGYRGYRYIRQGFRFDEYFFNVRMPFYDYDIIDFVMSLPESLLRNGKLYRKALLISFPEYFEKIPWQFTGLPISVPQPLSHLYSFFHRASPRIARLARMLNLPLRNRVQYTDYPLWTTTGEACGFIDTLLRNPDALYPEYIERTNVVAAWEKHLKLRNQTSFVNRYVTIEAWLQMVFRAKYREPSLLP